MPRIKNLALACVFLLSSVNASAILNLSADFPMPPEISRKVDFWEKIFLKYPSTSTVVHDLDHAELIIDLIDFVTLARQKKLKEIPWNMREKISNSFVERYALAVSRFKKHGKDAVKFGAIEERIWNVYARTPDLVEDLLSGKPRIRSQSGLADVFIKAAHRAEFYLPFMEKIFESHGVPAVITRLPFVESMFNLNAKSKQGALGIWQFMQTTAKKFMKVGHLVDERRSPFKATHAAAKYLKSSHQQLQSWPLTITSYNYGVSGIMKAVNNLNTRNIDFIVGNYKSPAFQYASKNFYAEFLAAVLVYNHLLSQGKVTEAGSTTDIRSFILNRRLSITELLAASGLNEELFKKYNPCVKDIAFTHFKKQKLPIPLEIFLPSQLANFAEKQINRRYSMSTQTGYSP